MSSASSAPRGRLSKNGVSTIPGSINVTRTPLVGGQWVRGKKHKYELVVVDNRTAPEVPTGGKLKLLG